MSLTDDSPDRQGAIDAEALALPAALRRYRLFEPLQEGFLVLDSAWCLLYLNPAAARILQRPRNTLLRTILPQSVPDIAGTVFAAELDASIASNAARSFRCYYPPSQTWLEGQTEPIEEGICVCLRDVTASRPIAEVVENIEEAFVLLDRAGNYVYVNRKAAQMANTTPEALMGKNGWELYPKAKASPIYETVEQVFATRQPAHLETTAPTLGITVEMTFYPQGEYVAIFTRDVTAQKRLQHALQESELLYRSLAENLPQLVWMALADGTVDYCNQRWYDYTGTDHVVDAYAAWERGLHPDDRDKTVLRWQQCQHTGQTFEAEYRFRGVKEATYRWHLGRAVPLRDEQGSLLRWFGTTTDIDAQKRAEERERFLGELTQQFRLLSDPQDLFWQTVCRLGEYLQVSRCLYAEIDAEADKLVIHRDYCDGVPSIAGTYPLSLFGPFVGEQARRGETILYEDFVTDPRSRDEYETAWKPLGIRALLGVTVLRDGQPIGGIALHSVEPRSWTPEEIALVERVMETMRLAMENIYLYRAAQQEIAERKRAEAALTERVNDIETIMNAAPVVISIAHDRECRRITGNAWAHRLLRVPDETTNLTVTGPEEENLTHITTWRDGRPLAAHELPLQYAAATGEEVRDQEIELHFADGSVAFCLGNASPLYDANGQVRGAVACFVDITEQKHRQTEMEALNERLRRAMSETHHRVKNNLQVIAALINLQTLQEKELVPVSELERLNQHVQVLATLHDLLTRRAKIESDTDDVSVQAAFDHLIPMLQSLTGGRALHCDIEDVRLPVARATTLLVLVNELVSNAVKHSKGEITVSFEVEGARVCLQVDDQGAGFPDDFNPQVAAHTGLELVESLARHDLQATTQYRTRSEGGGRVLIDFPVNILSRAPKQVQL